ncbi:hypothetical protein ACRAKI_19990 [Saccharothrix isguenensis]
MAPPTAPPSGDYARATFEQILHAVTGYGADLHGLADISGAAGNDGWFQFAQDFSTANMSYRAWDVHYFGVNYNQAAFRNWVAAVTEIEQVAQQLAAGRLGMMDVPRLWDAKRAVDTYVSWLDGGLETTKAWASRMDTDDSAFKGKAAFAIKVNLEALAFTFNDLRDQIMEDRKPATPTALGDSAEALGRFGQAMAYVWWESNTFLFNAAHDAATAISSSVMDHLRNSGLFVRYKDAEYSDQRYYVLDDFGSRADAEQYIRETMSRYFSTSAGQTPLPPGFPQLVGDISTKGFWDSVNAAISTYLRNELAKLDTKAREEFARLTEVHNRATRSLGDLKTTPPPTVGSKPPSFGGGGGGGGGGNGPSLDDILGNGNGNGNGGDGDGKGEGRGEGQNEQKFTIEYEGPPDPKDPEGPPNPEGANEELRNAFFKTEGDGTGSGSGFGGPGGGSGGSGNGFSGLGDGFGEGFGGSGSGGLGSGGLGSGNGQNFLGGNGGLGNGGLGDGLNGLDGPGGHGDQGGQGGQGSGIGAMPLLPAFRLGNPGNPGNPQDEERRKSGNGNGAFDDLDLPGNGNGIGMGNGNGIGNPLPGLDDIDGWSPTPTPDKAPLPDNPLPDLGSDGGMRFGPGLGPGQPPTGSLLDAPLVEAPRLPDDDRDGAGAGTFASAGLEGFSPPRSGLDGFGSGTGTGQAGVDVPGSGKDGFGGPGPGSGQTGFLAGSPEGHTDPFGRDSGGLTSQANPSGTGSRDDSRGGMPFMPPMMGGMGGLQGNQQQQQERERQTWLSEDEKVWGTDTGVGLGVIGRPDAEDVEADEVLVPTHVHVRSAAPRDRATGAGQGRTADSTTS